MRKVLYTLLTTIILLSYYVVFAEDLYTISNTTISPNLDVSYFSSYTISTNISPQPTSATLSLKGINGDGSDSWTYYADGSSVPTSLDLNLSFVSGTTWRNNGVRPDHIYPGIFFASASTTWNNSPQELSIRRNNYHLLHFVNPFTMTNGTSFWIEVNATPYSTANSADLQIYLVEKGHDYTFFESDWRSSASVELIGTLDRLESVSHTHTANSSHYLVTLSADSNGKVGTKTLDISNDFWIILYNTSPNVARGWDLRYQPSSLCTNTNRWYTGNFTRWTVANQQGCPDAHIHFARRTEVIDGIKATISAGASSSATSFYFATLPNLAPVAKNFTTPIAGVYSDGFTISWNAATDPNEGDAISYNIYLLNSSGSVIDTLTTGLGTTSLAWSVTGVANGTYSLKGQACDNATSSLCTDFYSASFSINKSDEIRSLTSITMSTSNTASTKGVVGDTVTLSFTANGEIQTPTVEFFSGGYAVHNSVTITNVSGNNWAASYVVDESDTAGQVTFILSGSDIDLEHTEVTSGSYATIEDHPEGAHTTSGDKDTKCRWSEPKKTTWINFKSTTKEGVSGLYLTWVQYNANKIDILIDDGTGDFPWKVSKTTNDGHEFLSNVADWQQIKVKPYNHCKEGNIGEAISASMYPYGWYNSF